MKIYRRVRSYFEVNIKGGQLTFVSVLLPCRVHLCLTYRTVLVCLQTRFAELVTCDQKIKIKIKRGLSDLNREWKICSFTHVR